MTPSFLSPFICLEADGVLVLRQPRGRCRLGCDFPALSTPMVTAAGSRPAVRRRGGSPGNIATDLQAWHLQGRGFANSQDSGPWRRADFPRGFDGVAAVTDGDTRGCPR